MVSRVPVHGVQGGVDMVSTPWQGVDIVSTLSNKTRYFLRINLILGLQPGALVTVQIPTLASSSIDRRFSLGDIPTTSGTRIGNYYGKSQTPA